MSIAPRKAAKSASPKEAQSPQAASFDSIEVTAREVVVSEAPLAQATQSSNKDSSVSAAGHLSAGLTLDQARQAFVRLKEAGEETNQAIETSYKLANSGFTLLSARIVDALKANSEHQFAFLHSLMAIRSPSEALSLQSDYFVQHYANLKAQTSDLVATAQKIALDSTQPLKASVAKTLKTAV